MKNKRGFTLIELLIVIAILAILAVIVIIAINPARILQRSRDSQRFSDLTSLATGINLYLADGQDFSGTCTAAAPCLSTSGTDADRRKNDGTGWVKINFTLVTSGAPLASVPADPTNNATNLYRFASGANKTYEIDAVFEASENNPSKHQNDGGNNSSKYEVGNDLTVLGI